MASGTPSTRPPWVRRVRRLLRPLKRTALGPAAVLLGLAARATSRRLAIAIVYHRVGDPPGEPATELVPSQSVASFRGQLGLFRRRYLVVPAAELVERAARRRRFERFCVAITFDDDWAGHADISLPLLREAGMPATFFLSGATLEGPYPFWYERVQEAFDRGVAPQVWGEGAEIHAVAARVEALPRAERDALIARLDSLLGPPPPDRGLRAQAVRALSEGGHEIGFHTCTHDTLTTLDDSELAAAMRDGRPELEALAGGPLEAIAYPSGKADAAVSAAARDAGFARGYSTWPVAIGPDSDPHRLGRMDAALHTVASLHLAIGRVLLGTPAGGGSTP